MWLCWVNICNPSKHANSLRRLCIIVHYRVQMSFSLAFWFSYKSCISHVSGKLLFFLFFFFCKEIITLKQLPEISNQHCKGSKNKMWLTCESSLKNKIFCYQFKSYYNCLIFSFKFHFTLILCTDFGMI